MERTNLYNPGFVGSQFHWWLKKLLTPQRGVKINPTHHMIIQRMRVGIQI